MWQERIRVMLLWTAVLFQVHGDSLRIIILCGEKLGNGRARLCSIVESGVSFGESKSLGHLPCLSHDTAEALGVTELG